MFSVIKISLLLYQEAILYNFNHQLYKFHMNQSKVRSWGEEGGHQRVDGWTWLLL